MSTGVVVRMKITLDAVAPPVSRTIEVPLDSPLDRLHSVFQAALAWTDSHLWEIAFGRTGFGVPDPEYGFDGPIDARKTTLAQALCVTGRKTFRYLYDFGDAWEHSVKIEKAEPADPQLTYPRTLKAIGERSPEDADELYGYAEMLEALGDAEHEYHEEALETLGEEYDVNRPPNVTFIEAKLAALAKNGRQSRGQHDDDLASMPPTVGAYDAPPASAG